MNQQLTVDKQKTLKDMILERKDNYATLLPKTVDIEEFMVIAIKQIYANPELANCTKESFALAVNNAAEMGLIPDGKHGALVPFNNKGNKEATFIPMYAGLMQIAYDTNLVSKITPHTVRENDHLEFELGAHPDLIHRPTLKNPGNPIAFYAMVFFKDGSYTFGPGPISMDEMQTLRKRSKAANSGPWVTDFEAMAWKTAIKRVLKFCPSNPRLEKALNADNENDFNGNTYEGELAREELNAAIDRQAKIKQAESMERATA